jgi:GDP-L-fucose synthase
VLKIKNQWRKLIMSKKTKILICGATGFIGKNLTLFFSKKNQFEVHAVNFKRDQYSVKNVVWHNVDLRNPEDVNSLLKNIDIVVQAAATTSGSKDIVTKPYIHVTDNAVMNSYIFRSAFENKVKHVVFFSCSVMYQSNPIPLKEEDYDPSMPLVERYFGVGHTKLYLEKMCSFFSKLSNTKYTAIRHSNIYGPHDKFDFEKSHFLGASISKVMLEEKKITIWGTGEEERDLLHVDDLSDFVYLVIKKQVGKFRLYNCGEGISRSVKEVVQTIIDVSGKNLIIETDTSQPSIKTSLSLDYSFAKKEIGWTPKVDLKSGLKSTLKWWKDNINPKNIR